MGEDTKIPTVGSMESIGTISYRSNGGSEGLGLGGGSVFSLVRLGDGLVRGLATSTVDRRSMGNKSMTDKAMTSKSMTDKATTSKSMTDKAMTSKSMTNKAMTSKSMTDNSRSMSNQRGSMNYRACCVNKRGSMDEGSSTDKRGLWVGCLTVISNLSDVAIVVIGVVVDVLNPSIRKSNRVATFTHTSSIIRLCS